MNGNIDTFLGFNSGFAPAPLKGNPKVVRVEKGDFQGTGGLRLQQVCTFLPSHRIAEMSSYQSDGSIEYQDVYEYSDDSRTTTQRTFGRAGELVQVIRTVQTDAEIQQAVTNSEGKLVTSTIAKLDDHSRPIEAVLTDHINSSKWRVTQQYDSDGRSLGGEVVFEGMPDGFPPRVVIPGQGNRAVAMAYASNGTVIFNNELQREATQDGTVTELSRTQFAGGGQQRATVERIDSRDTEGNWTKKTIFASNTPDSQEEPVAEVYRTITYYEP